MGHPDRAVSRDRVMTDDGSSNPASTTESIAKAYLAAVPFAFS
jgi:hypothetical protein